MPIRGNAQDDTQVVLIEEQRSVLVKDDVERDLVQDAVERDIHAGGVPNRGLERFPKRLIKGRGQRQRGRAIRRSTRDRLPHAHAVLIQRPAFERPGIAEIYENGRDRGVWSHHQRGILCAGPLLSVVEGKADELDGGLARLERRPDGLPRAARRRKLLPKRV
jgi:hypothetical protein